LHAHAVRHALTSRRVACAIVETDCLAAAAAMSWSISSDCREHKASISDRTGETVDLRNLDVVWWRRLTGAARLPDNLTDEAARDLVVRDCRATLWGLALTGFQGVWVSDPQATRVAENKLVQLKAATNAELHVPRTLVSQDPNQVRAFCSELEFQVVVKTVAGTPKTPVMTGFVAPEMLTDEAVKLCPAIYQEFVPGNRHLRVCCFGEDVYAALLTTDRLDWRYPLDASVERYDIDRVTAQRLQQVLKSLRLEMGVFDMKLTPQSEPVWLEVNPQGQFLFLEGLCGMPLTEIFANFLLEVPRRSLMRTVVPR
jgi:hypothetical protein